MSYFYSEQLLIPNQTQIIKGEETRHIRLVRKIRPGETIVLQDETFNRHQCSVTKVKNSFIEFVTGERIIPPDLPAHTIHVAIGMVKEKALDLILQKCTELGIGSVLLFQSEYSRRLPKGPVRDNKLSRWQKIMAESCKQCERMKPPALHLYEELTDMVSAFPESGNVKSVVVHPQSEAEFKLTYRPDSTSETLLIIGPEGGFSPQDLDKLPKQYLHLGSLILRTETAVITAVSTVRALSAVSS